MICQQSSFWLSFALVELRGALYTCNSDKKGAAAALFIESKGLLQAGVFSRVCCNLLFLVLLTFLSLQHRMTFPEYILKYILLTEYIRESISCLSVFLFRIWIQIITDSRTQPDIRLHIKFLHSDLSKAAVATQEISFATSIGIENFP